MKIVGFLVTGFALVCPISAFSKDCSNIALQVGAIEQTINCLYEAQKANTQLYNKIKELEDKISRLESDQSDRDSDRISRTKITDIEDRIRSIEERQDSMADKSQDIVFLILPTRELERRGGACSEGILCLSSVQAICDAKGYKGGIPQAWSSETGETAIMCLGRK